jgi:hypothetical protein
MTKTKATKTAVRTTVTMLGDEAERTGRGCTVWRVQRGERVAMIAHAHETNLALRAAHEGAPFVVGRVDVTAGTTKVHSADFSDALRVAHKLLGGAR